MSEGVSHSDLWGRLILALGLVGLLMLGYRVMHLFFAPVAWAVILAYVTWPVHLRVRGWLGGHEAAGALIMTLLLAATFALPLLWVASLLRAEIPAVYHAAVHQLAQGPDALPASIVRIPWLGQELQDRLRELSADPAAIRDQLVQWAKPWLDESLGVLGDIGRNAFKLGFALLTAFFFYRDGAELLDQARRVLMRFLGERTRHYLTAVADTTRAVLYGLVLTAMVQGLFAGLGYWVAGLPAPATLGALTAVFALIPFGTPLVWGLSGIWLLLTGETAAGVGLLLWGALVVSQIDNLFRPLVISSATRIPYLLVLFGVLGGLAGFGLIGLFVGPIIVAVLLAVWREWLEEQV